MRELQKFLALPCKRLAHPSSTKKLLVKKLEHLPPEPGEVGGVGAEGGLVREGDAAAVEVGELEVGPSGEDGFGDDRK